MIRKSSKILFFALILTAATSFAFPVSHAQAGLLKLIMGATKAGAAGKTVVEGAEALGKSTKILEETVPRGLKDGESRTPEYVREWLERAPDAHHAHELLKSLEGTGQA
jgi:hypothetical protein